MITHWGIQIVARLFPFKRGLCHSYWAPNFWALYNVIDKGLSIGASLLDPEKKYSHGVMTSGLVQEYEHNILPTITPVITALLVLLSMVPCLWKLWNSPGNPLHFVRAVIICTSCSFIFGWHVHEKAVLMIMIPQSLMAVLGRNEAEAFTLLSIVGHYSLMPLIYTRAEFIIKMLMFALYTYYVIFSLSDLFRSRFIGPIPLLGVVENIYIVGLGALFMYENVLHSVLKFDEKYPFLPLMLTSSYCSIGIMYTTCKYYFTFWKMHFSEHKIKIF